MARLVADVADGLLVGQLTFFARQSCFSDTDHPP